MAIKYPDENTPMIPELRPNKGLIDIRKIFGIPGEYLLSDANQYYTNMNDENLLPDNKLPIDKIKSSENEGINALLPIIRNDDDNRGGITDTTQGSNFKFLGDEKTTDLRDLTDKEFFSKIFGQEYDPYKSDADPSVIRTRTQMIELMEMDAYYPNIYKNTLEDTNPELFDPKVDKGEDENLDPSDPMKTDQRPFPGILDVIPIA